MPDALSRSRRHYIWGVSVKFAHLLARFADPAYGPLLLRLEMEGQLPDAFRRAKEEAGFIVPQQQPTAIRVLPSQSPPRLDCRELGPVLPGQESCGCTQKRRRCALHVVCTAAAVMPPVGPPLISCDVCPDRIDKMN